MNAEPHGEKARGSVARRVQLRLESFYEIEAGPDIADYVRAAENDEREAVFVRGTAGEDAELAVVLPREGLVARRGPLSLDTLCQIVEGVSHFVYLAGRIRSSLPVTQLELELQAEVDKFVLLAYRAFARDDREAVWDIHTRLYDRVAFAHDDGTEIGRRYRLANELAARFCARLGRREPGGGRGALLRFYRGGQAEKIRLARAA